MLNKQSMIKVAMLVAVTSTILLTGCQTMKERVLDSSADGQTSVELRSIQTRAFDTNDKPKTMRSTIESLPIS